MPITADNEEQPAMRLEGRKNIVNGACAHYRTTKLQIGGDAFFPARWQNPGRSRSGMSRSPQTVGLQKKKSCEIRAGGSVAAISGKSTFSRSVTPRLLSAIVACGDCIQLLTFDEMTVHPWRKPHIER